MNFDHPNLSYDTEPCSDFYMERPGEALFGGAAELGRIEAAMHDENFHPNPERWSSYAVDSFNQQNALRDIEDYYHGDQQVKSFAEHSSKCKCSECVRTTRHAREAREEHEWATEAAPTGLKQIQRLQRRNDLLLMFVVFLAFVVFYQASMIRAHALLDTRPAPVAPPSSPLM